MLASTTACNRQEATGQTVAVVNDKGITASELKLELNNVPPASRESVKGQVLQAMIDRRLLAADAEAQKLDKAPGFILQERRMREVMLAQQALQGFAAASRRPISQNDVNAYIDSHPNIAADRRILLVSQVQFTTPSQEVLKALVPTQTIDELVAVLQQNKVAMQRGRAQVDTAAISDEEMAKLASLKPGEPLVSTSGPTSVASAVIEQRAAPLNQSEQEAVARRRIEAERAQKAVKQRTAGLRQAAKISYSDAYKPKPGAKPAAQ
ncbi:hypothetical protein ABC969_04000 [Sphingomonas qilianensis]|uniref:Peptidyl-prolyl cis-trans isomerase, EpsD family n=1 Tax=Sphingomonas qilianensis TaxID=1736690 RepID=A0ABU9XP21_9SPHN